MTRLLLALALGLSLPGTLAGQTRTDLARVAEEARKAWQRQDAEALLSGGGRVTLRLPDAEPSAPVGRQQAIRLLRGLFERSREVQTVVSDVRVVGEGQGYVELRRRYRTAGTQETREHLVLLSFREADGGWVLVELRVGGRPG